MRFRLRTLLVVLAILPLLIWGVVSVWPPTVMVWDGGFTLHVQYVNETGKMIDRMEAAVVEQREQANVHLSNGSRSS
jgi:hypothetical protein